MSCAPCVRAWPMLPTARLLRLLPALAALQSVARFARHDEAQLDGPFGFLKRQKPTPRVRGMMGFLYNAKGSYYHKFHYNPHETIDLYHKSYECIMGSDMEYRLPDVCANLGDATWLSTTCRMPPCGTDGPFIFLTRCACPRRPTLACIWAWPYISQSGRLQGGSALLSGVRPQLRTNAAQPEALLP